MVMQREPVNVIAEVCVVVLAKVGIIKSGAFGKDMIEVTLIHWTRKRGRSMRGEFRRPLVCVNKSWIVSFSGNSFLKRIPGGIS